MKRELDTVAKVSGLPSPQEFKPLIGKSISFERRLTDIRDHAEFIKPGCTPEGEEGLLAEFRRKFGSEDKPKSQRPGEFPDTKPNGEPNMREAFLQEKVHGRPYFTIDRVSQAVGEVATVVGGDPKPEVTALDKLPKHVLKAFQDAGVTVLGDHEYGFQVGSFKGGQYAPTFFDNLERINNDPSIKGIMFSSGNAIQGVLYTVKKLKELKLLREDFKVIMVAYSKLDERKRQRILTFNQGGRDVVEIKNAEDLFHEFKETVEKDKDFDTFRKKLRKEEDTGKQPKELDPNDLDDLHMIMEYYAWKNNLFHTPYSNTPGTILGGAVMYQRIKEGVRKAAEADANTARKMPKPTVSKTTGKEGISPHLVFMGLGGGSPGAGVALGAYLDGDRDTLMVGCMPADRPITAIADSYQIPMIQWRGVNALKAFGSNRFQMADVLEEYIFKAFVDLNKAGYAVEPSGAIPLALLYMLLADPEGRKKIQGKTVVLVFSGGNFKPETLEKAEEYYEQKKLGRADYFENN